MAITDTGGGAINNSNNAGTYVTGSYTPAANDLLVSLGGISETAIDATFSDSQGMTSDLLVGEAFTSGVAMMGYLAVGQTLATAVARTMTMDVTGDNGTGGHLTVRRIAGGRATQPFYRQFNFASGGAGTTPAVVMSQAFNTNNAGLAIVLTGTNPPALTIPSGWSEITDAGHATPDMGMWYGRRLSGETASTITWGSTSATAWFAIVVEIYEASQGPTGIIPRIMHHRKQLGAH